MCGCELGGVRRCPGLGCAVVPRVRGAMQAEFLLCRYAENCTRSASLKSGLRTRNTHRSRRPPEDKPKGQGARRARPPLVGCICGLADSTSSAPALRCCRCCRVARRGTVCPAPLPLGTACPIPCSSPHCTPVRVSCAPLPAKARVGPASAADCDVHQYERERERERPAVRTLATRDAENVATNRASCNHRGRPRD